MKTLRTLILLRHAAAASPAPDGGDFERALTAAGRTEAEAAGRRLAALALRPQLLLTSPARRTRATADIVARCLGLAGTALRADAGLYLGAVPALRAAIARVDPGIGCLLVVGHNPALSELAGALAADGGGALPTGAFERIDLSLDSWQLP